MKDKIIDLVFGLLFIAALLMVLKLVLVKKQTPVLIEPIALTNTDTIYKEIEVLKLKSDTIKLYYEKKINNYRILPTPERVRIFADRINR